MCFYFQRVQKSLQIKPDSPMIPWHKKMFWTLLIWDSIFLFLLIFFIQRFSIFSGEVFVFFVGIFWVLGGCILNFVCMCVGTAPYHKDLDLLYNMKNYLKKQAWESCGMQGLYWPDHTVQLLLPSLCNLPLTNWTLTWPFRYILLKIKTT